MTKPFSHTPDETTHEELLAEAFRHHTPPTEDPGRDLPIDDTHTDPTVGSLDLAERNSFRRVTRDTEIRSEDHEDIYEVEYRKLRLEQVILVGMGTEGTMAEVEANMNELAALALSLIHI